MAATLLTLVLVAAQVGADDPVTLLYFGADGCPYCVEMEAFLDDLETRFGDDIEVVRYEFSVRRRAG